MMRRLIPDRRRLTARLALGAAWAIVVLGTLYVARAPLPTGLTTLLTLETVGPPADYIVPRYHDADSISTVAAEFYRRRLAPRAIVHRVESGRLDKLGLVPPAHESWRTLLKARGVPPHAIETLGTAVGDEVDLGRLLARFRRDAEPIRAIVIASTPLGRLSRDALRQGLEAAPIALHLYPVTPTASMSGRGGGPGVGGSHTSMPTAYG